MTPWKANPRSHKQILTPEGARDVALNLLARRDHSRLELRHKLTQRGVMSPIIDAVLDHLVGEGLINEARYAEVYAHGRSDKGYGPLRIQQELCERGIDEAIITITLNKLGDFWMSNLVKLHHKRWSSKKVESVADEVKRMRFLRQRGFTLEQIRQLFKTL